MNKVYSFDPSISSGKLAVCVFDMSSDGEPYEHIIDLQVWKTKIKPADDRNGMKRGKDIAEWVNNLLIEGSLVITEDLVNKPNWARGERRVRGRARSLQLTQVINTTIVNVAQFNKCDPFLMDPPKIVTSKKKRLVIINSIIPGVWQRFGVRPSDHLGDAIYRGRYVIKMIQCGIFQI